MNRAGRAKLSTTVAAENYQFLANLVKAGKVSSLAEAVDEAIENLRKRENRRRLAAATAEYFESLSPAAIAEENALADAMARGAEGIDFDNEV